MDKFDLIIQKNSITVPVRKDLAKDTLQVLSQVKQARRARRILAVAFALATLLLIAKWVNNDLLYLVKVVFYKYGLVRSQSFLYLQAFFESLPKQQILTVLITSMLWLAWRRFETFIAHSRITNARNKFAMKAIKLTPRLIIANTLLVVSVLGFSGYSYAQKAEQEKLKILKERVNQTGRIELDTNFEENCKSRHQDYRNNLTNQFEIKKGSGLSTADAQKILEATCYSREVNRFFYKHFPDSKDEKFVSISVGIAYKVVSISGNSLIAEVPNTSDKIQIPPQITVLEKETKVYKDEKLVSQDSLKKGDIVMFMNRYAYISEEGGEPTSVKTLGVYILPSVPEFAWYNPNVVNAITQIQTCMGNPEDRCSFTGSIDFFPSGGGEANSQNPLWAGVPFFGEEKKDSPVLKEIAGTLTEIDDKFVKIKSSSGRVFTVNFGSNPVEEFNRDRAQFYDNNKVVLGDTLLVRYSERSDQHSTILNITQIENAVLMIEVSLKSEPVKKY